MERRINMTTETMNVHKALCELKILESRISSGIRACKFVSVKKKASKMVGSQSVEDFKNTERSNYDSVMCLIRRREAIKRAVVLSNATTKVVVAGKEYTVAEAIEMKNHGLDGKNKLRDCLSLALRQAEVTMESANAEADHKADAYIQGIAGGKELKSEEIKSIRDGYLAGLVVEVVDPMPGGARAVLEELTEEISAFLVEVDSALSTSNALTQITVEY